MFVIEIHVEIFHTKFHRNHFFQKVEIIFENNECLLFDTIRTCLYNFENVWKMECWYGFCKSRIFFCSAIAKYESVMFGCVGMTASCLKDALLADCRNCHNQAKSCPRDWRFLTSWWHPETLQTPAHYGVRVLRGWGGSSVLPTLCREAFGSETIGCLKRLESNALVALDS